LLRLSDKEITMALPLNQAQAIAQRLSNEQLMKSYTDGSLPQFIVFSEMQRRQQAVNSGAKVPTETVAEKMIGRPIGGRPDVEPEGGLSSLEKPVAAKTGGFISSLAMMDFGSLPPAAQKELGLRMSNMPTGSYLSKQSDGSNLAKGGSVHYAGGTDDDTVDGGDDGNDGSGNGGEPTQVTRSDFVPNNIPVSPQYVFNRLKQKGYSDQAAAAVAGNVQHEIGHGGGTATAERGVKTPGIGLSQWSPVRFNALKSFASERNANPYDPDTQIDFIDHELNTTEKSSGDKLFAAKDVKSAHNAFLGFLRPKYYSSKDPTKSSAYNERLANASSILGIGSMRDTPEGADLPSQLTSGLASAITPEGSTYTGMSGDRDKYPYNNKGLSSLNAASYLENLAQGRRKIFSNGGPVYLKDGSDGDTVKSARDLQSTQRLMGILKATGNDSPFYSTINPPTPTDYPISDSEEYNIRLDKAMHDYQDQKFKEKYNIGNLTPEETEYYSRASKLDPDSVSEQPQGTGMERFTTPESMEGREPISIGQLFPPSPFSEWKKPSPTAEKKDQPSGITTLSTPDYSEKMEGARFGLPSAKPPAAQGPTPPVGDDKGNIPVNASGGPRTTTEERDNGFDSVMAQVKKSIGSDLSSEFVEQKKDFQNNLKQMQNDKIVDTLLAAAKTFAGQRKGQFNIGDAVANAGLAAQEAQKRIYKAEDDMRKYRLDLLKAQQDGDYKSASLAMQKIIQSDHDKKSLQIASMQAQKAHQTAEMQMNRYEKMYDIQGKRATLTALHNRAETIRKSYMTGMPMSEEDKAEMRSINSQIDDLTGQLGGKSTGAAPTHIYDNKTGKLIPYSAS
jgi:Phage tail lysozyme